MRSAGPGAAPATALQGNARFPQRRNLHFDCQWAIIEQGTDAAACPPPRQLPFTSTVQHTYAMPSSQVDWSFLHNYNVVIGLNKIHYGFERFNLTVSHHISVNPLVAEQMKSDLITEFDCRTIKLQRYDIMKFLPCDTAHYNILPFASPSQARTPRCGPFCKDITRGIQEGWTVTYAGLQVRPFLLRCAMNPSDNRFLFLSSDCVLHRLPASHHRWHGPQFRTKG